MSLFGLKVYLRLIQFDLYLTGDNFSALHRKVRDFPLCEAPQEPGTVEKICTAVDIACIWYPKEVLCLQRSAATVCLLKRYGVPAQLMIGAQQIPFKAHAWVEVEGRVVNDKPYMREKYLVLDKC